MTDHDLLISIHTSVERIVKLLDGNGKPGLVRDVAVLQDDMRRREEEADRLKEAAREMRDVELPQNKQDAKISARWNSGVIATIVTGVVLGVAKAFGWA